MRFIVAISIALALSPQLLANSALPPLPRAPVEDSVSLRLIYRGEWGTFHLFGHGATAGYVFRGRRYVAEMQLIRETDVFYYFVPASGGDPAILQWAFAKLRGPSGRAWVWRQTPEGWSQYECADCFGTYSRQVRILENANVDTDERVDALQRDVEDHESRIKALEGGS